MNLSWPQSSAFHRRLCFVLQGIERVRHIPCIAVQGRLDFVTPVRTAYDLHCAWPEMELRVVPVRPLVIATAKEGCGAHEVLLGCCTWSKSHTTAAVTVAFVRSVPAADHTIEHRR